MASLQTYNFFLLSGNNLKNPYLCSCLNSIVSLIGIVCMNIRRLNTAQNRVFRLYCRYTGRLFAALSLVFLIATSMVMGGELSLSPALPRIGDKVSFTYKPDSAWRKAENIYAIVYRFNEISGEPIADYTKLSRRLDGMFAGDIAVTPNTVFLMVKLFNGSRYDDNNGNYWDARVSADGAKPVQGAYLRNAITFLGSLPLECSRSSDFPKALALMREELRLYPNNLAAKIAEVALGYDLKDISEETYRRSLQSSVTMPFDTTRENDTRAVMRGLNALGMANEATALRTAYIKRFPKSKIAEESAMEAIQVQVVPDWFIGQATSFVARFPESPTTPMMQGAAMATFAQVRRLKDAAKWLDTIPNPSPVAYNELAKYWCRTDTSEERGLRFAQKALEMAQRQPLQRRPPHISEVEWKLNTNATLGDMYNTLSAIYVELKRPDDALATFTKALDITDGELPAPAFAQAAAILAERKRFSEAYSIASRGIITSGGDDILLKWHRFAYDSLQGGKTNTEQYNAALALLRDSATQLTATKQMQQRLDRPFIDGTVFTTDNTPIDLASFKGKPVMIMFWSSWAEPCVKSMPFINMQVKRYNESGRAAIIVIDAWEEKGKDQFTLVRDYIARNSTLSIPIYVDKDNIMAQKFGVTGLPMRFYLDKNGRIQYKGSGFTDGIKLSQEIEGTLQLLMNERFYAYQ